MLYNSDGHEIAKGYTTVTFSSQLTAGDTYSVSVGSYTVCTFARWQDTGSSNPERTFVANGTQTFVGVYVCTNAIQLNTSSPSNLGIQSLQLIGLFVLAGSTAYLRDSRARKKVSKIIGRKIRFVYAMAFLVR